jgi:hypothetical protein
MVEVEDLNHYGVGLFDFASGTLTFSLALTGSLEGDWGKGFALWNPQYISNLNYIIY